MLKQKLVSALARYGAQDLGDAAVTWAVRLTVVIMCMSYTTAAFYHTFAETTVALGPAAAYWLIVEWVMRHAETSTSTSTFTEGEDSHRKFQLLPNSRERKTMLLAVATAAAMYPHFDVEEKGMMPMLSLELLYDTAVVAFAALSLFDFGRK